MTRLHLLFTTSFLTLLKCYSSHVRTFPEENASYFKRFDRPSSTHRIGKYLNHYSPLHYTPLNLKRRKRDDDSQNLDLFLDTKDRNFHLKLAPDTSLFSSDDEPTDHLYYGHLHGEAENSTVHGAIIDGVFQHGVIHTDDGNFYIEHVKEHLEGLVSPVFHSIIYHESDLKYPFDGHKVESNCGHCNEHLKPPSDWLKVEPNEDKKRVKRSHDRYHFDLKKTTCVLRIEIDYPYFKHYGNREEVVASVASHVRAASEIYRTTKFELSTGEQVRGINFQVKRIVIN